MSTILELNNIKKAYDVKMAVDIDKLVIESGEEEEKRGKRCGSHLTFRNALDITVYCKRILK